jgi:hypothetical protein
MDHGVGELEFGSSYEVHVLDDKDLCAAWCKTFILLLFGNENTGRVAARPMWFFHHFNTYHLLKTKTWIQEGLVYYDGSCCMILLFEGRCAVGAQPVSLWLMDIFSAVSNKESKASSSMGSTACAKILMSTLAAYNLNIKHIDTVQKQKHHEILYSPTHRALL